LNPKTLDRRDAIATMIPLALLLALVMILSACSDDDPPGQSDSAVDARGPDAGSDARGGEAGADATLEAAPDSGPTCGAGFTPKPGLVVTHLGAIEGKESGQSWAFLGVPFAEPPSGALRWKPPQDPPCWNDLKPTKAFAAVCTQKKFVQGSPNGVIKGQEDCLYLNVWRPKAAAATPRPVLFFIHGGGNTAGSASEDAAGTKLYDGALLAERGDVVVVTIQYRLGPLGFLALPELTAASATPGSGNYGLMDQVHALKWVQRNIGAFGGDPKRVLVFGESAGAVNTCMMVATPLAKGMFSAALMQSGACVARTLADAEAAGTAFAKEMGCDAAADKLDCLHKLDGKTLVANLTSALSGGLAGGNNLGPAIDGHVLPAAPLDIIGAGTHNKVPMIVGSNADETKPTVPAGSVTPLKVSTFFATIPEPHRSALLALYPPGTTNAEARESWIRVTTDSQFICSARRTLRALKKGQSEPVYRYQFTHKLPGLWALLGAFHGLELFYVFQAAENSDYAAQLTTADTNVAASLLGYWTRLAATGDPNGGGATAWPAYVSATDPYLELADPPQAKQALRSAYCDAWDAFTASAP
jgi:para-nitrobenzyl esterase